MPNSPSKQTQKAKKQHRSHPKIRPSKEKRRTKFINNLKLLAKDLKRSRWTNVSDSRKTFVKVAIFIIVIGLALYGIAIGFTALWNAIGVGPNE